MNHKWIFLLITLLALISLQSYAFDKGSIKAGHSFDIMATGAYVKYNESMDHWYMMDDQGGTYGVEGAWLYRYPKYGLIKADIHYSRGDFNYHSADTGSMDDQPYNFLETRIVVGRDFDIQSRYITPYFGFGYRYVENDTGNMQSSTGYWGYFRSSNYYYSPLGVSAQVFVGDVWELNVTAEYDIFWHGLQKSGGHGAPFSFKNDQNSGFGVRGSVRLLRKLSDDVRLIIEPYFKLWDIKKSEEDCLADGECAFEPDNTTQELGFKVGLNF